jgi:hypothetical protein
MSSDRAYEGRADVVSRWLALPEPCSSRKRQRPSRRTSVPVRQYGTMRRASLATSTNSSPTATNDAHVSSPDTDSSRHSQL